MNQIHNTGASERWLDAVVSEPWQSPVGEATPAASQGRRMDEGQRKGATRGSRLSLWLLTIVLSAVFCAAGLAKLTGAPEMVANFQRFGYGDTFRLLIGAGELSAAVLLLFPKTSAAAAWLLICIMLGALGTHLTMHEYGTAMVPLVLGTLCTVLAFARRPASLRKPYLVSMRELDRLWEQEHQFDNLIRGKGR